MSGAFNDHDLFVSPGGNDAWQGNIPDPNAAGGNGPLKTVAKAQQVIRIRKSRGEFAGPVTVWLRAGEHVLARPLTFTPEDSFVNYAAFPGEAPVINAGVRIERFTPATVNGRAAWKADVASVIDKRGYFQQLFVNGSRRTRARLPKQGFFVVEDIPERRDSPLKPGTFRARAGDLQAWRNPSEIEIVTLNLWVEQRLRLVSYDQLTRIVRYARRTRPLRERANQYARYYLENIAEELTEPGEWYLDKERKELLYLPCSGESIDTAVVVASMEPVIVEVLGKPDEGRCVECLCFKGLTFSYADWRQPRLPAPGQFPRPEKGGNALCREYDLRADPASVDPATEIASTSQSSMLLPGAIFFEGARNCAMEECTVSHVGMHAVELGCGCKGMRLIGNTIVDTGGGGIKVNGEFGARSEPLTTGNNLITDNHIHDCGIVFPGASAIVVMHSYGNLIAHNHVHDLYYTGISIGATWGYGENSCLNNRIEKNVVHAVGKKILSDCAGIYLLGVHGGTSVRHNVVYDITKSDYGAFGINLDEGIKHVLVEGNLFHDIGSQAFHLHFGEENIIRNNVFALAREGLIGLSRGSDCRWASKTVFGGGDISKVLTFERNIVVTDGQPVFIGGLGDKTGNVATRCCVSDLNVFHDVRGADLYFGDGVHGTGGREALFNVYTWDQWRDFGYDAHSVVADPRFGDITAGDFSLRESSPALALGFRPLDIADAGVRPPEKRTGWLRRPLTELDTEKFGYW